MCDICEIICTRLAQSKAINLKEETINYTHIPTLSPTRTHAHFRTTHTHAHTLSRTHSPVPGRPRSSAQCSAANARSTARCCSIFRDRINLTPSLPTSRGNLEANSGLSFSIINLERRIVHKLHFNLYLIRLVFNQTIKSKAKLLCWSTIQEHCGILTNIYKLYTVQTLHLISRYLFKKIHTC